jgi:hypothetical protein
LYGEGSGVLGAGGVSFSAEKSILLRLVKGVVTGMLGVTLMLVAGVTVGFAVPGSTGPTKSSADGLGVLWPVATLTDGDNVERSTGDVGVPALGLIVIVSTPPGNDLAYSSVETNRNGGTSLVFTAGGADGWVTTGPTKGEDKGGAVTVAFGVTDGRLKSGELDARDAEANKSACDNGALTGSDCEPRLLRSIGFKPKSRESNAEGLNLNTITQPSG